MGKTNGGQMIELTWSGGATGGLKNGQTTMPLSGPLLRALRKNGVETAEELFKRGRSEVMSWRDIGQSRMGEILRGFHAVGIDWRDFESR
jgi:hypothetical protein